MEKNGEHSVDKSGVIDYKGHELTLIHYRTPTSCESCNKPLGHIIHPPPALECKSKYKNFNLGQKILIICFSGTFFRK